MLDAYIDAPDVFEAYPELRNVKVEFEALKGNEKLVSPLLTII